ncbi:hypothetical protein E4U54_001992, partial [Claviceps lovelessii]
AVGHQAADHQNKAAKPLQGPDSADRDEQFSDAGLGEYSPRKRAEIFLSPDTPKVYADTIATAGDQ